MKFKSMYRDMELELKNCPFCGSEPIIKHIGNKHTKIVIEIRCKNCNASKRHGAIHRGMDWLEDISVDSWNMRATPSTKQD